MGLPIYYKFDRSLGSELEVLFTEHKNHVVNFREHLAGFAAVPEEQFDIFGGVETVDGIERLTCANGNIRQMQQGVALVVEDKQALLEWVWQEAFPTTTEALPAIIKVPGRWLTPEESSRRWLLASQLILPGASLGLIRAVLAHHGIHQLDRFTRARATPKDR